MEDPTADYYGDEMQGGNGGRRGIEENEPLISGNNGGPASYESTLTRAGGHSSRFRDGSCGTVPQSRHILT